MRPAGRMSSPSSRFHLVVPAAPRACRFRTVSGVAALQHPKGVGIEFNPVYHLAPMQDAHSVLNPASPQAAAIAHLLRIFFSVAGIIWLIVLGALAYALARPKRLGERDGDSRLRR